MNYDYTFGVFKLFLHLCYPSTCKVTARLINRPPTSSSH